MILLTFHFVSIYRMAVLNLCRIKLFWMGSVVFLQRRYPKWPTKSDYFKGHIRHSCHNMCHKGISKNALNELKWLMSIRAHWIWWISLIWPCVDRIDKYSRRSRAENSFTFQQLPSSGRFDEQFRIFSPCMKFQLSLHVGICVCLYVNIWNCAPIIDFNKRSKFGKWQTFRKTCRMTAACAQRLLWFHRLLLYAPGNLPVFLCRRWICWRNTNKNEWITAWLRYVCTFGCYSWNVLWNVNGRNSTLTGFQQLSSHLHSRNEPRALYGRVFKTISDVTIIDAPWQQYGPATAITIMYRFKARYHHFSANIWRKYICDAKFAFVSNQFSSISRQFLVASFVRHDVGNFHFISSQFKGNINSVQIKTQSLLAQDKSWFIGSDLAHKRKEANGEDERPRKCDDDAEDNHCVCWYCNNFWITSISWALIDYLSKTCTWI